MAIVAGCAAGNEADSDAHADARPDAPDPIDAPDVDAPEFPATCGTGSDGMLCGPGDACHDPRICMNARCVARPLPDGTVCAQPSDACHTAGTCRAGNCGPQGVRPNGYNYAPGALNRCCGGRPVQTNTAQHCGVCGISCGANACISVGGRWQCACNGSNAQCWSNCCATSAGPPYVCSPSTCGNPAFCIPCPGGGICTMASPHYYCHY